MESNIHDNLKFYIFSQAETFVEASPVTPPSAASAAPTSSGRSVLCLIQCFFGNQWFNSSEMELMIQFCSQGADSNVAEKAASALMTVELDKEEGPQIQVQTSKLGLKQADFGIYSIMFKLIE